MERGVHSESDAFARGGGGGSLNGGQVFGQPSAQQGAGAGGNDKIQAPLAPGGCPTSPSRDGGRTNRCPLPRGRGPSRRGGRGKCGPDVSNLGDGEPKANRARAIPAAPGRRLGAGANVEAGLVSRRRPRPR